jgi:hypothetical protein
MEGFMGNSKVYRGKEGLRYQNFHGKVVMPVFL